jgi:hypothetical protein
MKGSHLSSRKSGDEPNLLNAGGLLIREAENHVRSVSLADP